MEDRTSVSVRIAGEEHAIRSSAPREYTLRCARLVDDRINDIRRRSGLVEGHKAAILAALSITDEYFKAQGELERLQAEVESRVDTLTRHLGDALDQG